MTFTSSNCVFSCYPEFKCTENESSKPALSSSNTHLVTQRKHNYKLNELSSFQNQKCRGVEFLKGKAMFYHFYSLTHGDKHDNINLSQHTGRRLHIFFTCFEILYFLIYIFFIFRSDTTMTTTTTDRHLTQHLKVACQSPSGWQPSSRLSLPPSLWRTSTPTTKIKRCF